MSRPTILLDMAAAWSGQLVFDIIVFLLTLWQCLQTRMKGYKDLMGVFLRDGELATSLPSVILPHRTTPCLGCD